MYQAPKAGEKHSQHRNYPYLPRHLAIERRYRVWCADLTYHPLLRRFLYLIAITDWFSREVLASRLLNTTETDVGIATLERRPCALVGPTS